MESHVRHVLAAFSVKMHNYLAKLVLRGRSVPRPPRRVPYAQQESFQKKTQAMAGPCVSHVPNIPSLQWAANY